MLLSRRQAICGAGAAIAAPLAAPYVARAHFQINPATNRVYSKRAIELVQRAVVIDMLAPIKIDFSPEYYAKELSEKEAADFRAKIGRKSWRERVCRYVSVPVVAVSL